MVVKETKIRSRSHLNVLHHLCATHKFMIIIESWPVIMIVLPPFETNRALKDHESVVMILINCCSSTVATTGWTRAHYLQK